MKYVEIAILVIAAFLPPIVYAIWIRNTEKYNREKWKSIALCFLWGASIAVIASIILESILHISLAISFEGGDIFGLSIAIFIAPFVEELTKPLALRLKTVKRS